MAFLDRLVSVSQAEVDALRADENSPLTPTLSVLVSHLIAYWVQVQPLGRLLGQAVDGGTVLNKALRHQLRDPCYHGPEVVRTLYMLLSEAWQDATSAQPVPPDDWYRIEIEKVLRLFAHAADRGECVVSALEPCHGIHFKKTA
jgi:hypothetical protein